MADGSREIERKFLLDGPPDWLDRSGGRKIRQGYVAVTENGTEVRLREEGDRHVLTIKEGHGESRGETEFAIGAAQFAALWPLTKGRRLKKVRHEFPREGFTFAVDVYRGKLKGLATAEVEFSAADVSHNFQPPAWLGREVTDDATYRNQNLARHGLPHES